MKYNIRRWKYADIEDLMKQMNNIHIWKTLSDNTPFPFTQEDGKKHMDYAVKNCVDRDSHAVEVNGEVVGGISFIRQEPPYSSVYLIKYWISPDYWNESIMSDAISNLVKNCFFHFPVMKILARVIADNQTCMQMLETVGFRQEATLKEMVLKNGKVSDLHLYTLCEDQVLG